MQDHSLSQRQHQILLLVAEGMDNKTIARELGISYKTVKNQLVSVFKKINVQTRTQAAIWIIAQHNPDLPIGNGCSRVSRL